MPPAAASTHLLLLPLDFLGRHATTLLFAGVFVGLALPDLAALARPLLPPAVVLLLTATLLRLNWPAIGQELRRPALQFLLFPWQQLLLPLVVWGLCSALPIPDSLTTALVLMALAPPIMSSAALAALLGLAGPLALVGALLATLLTPLVLPPVALGLLGLELEIGLADFMLRLGALIGLALLFAVGCRLIAGPARLARVARPIDGIVVLIMLVFVVAIMDGVTERALERPDIALGWLIAAWLANPLLQALGAAVFWRLGRQRALTVGLMTGNRNMGLLLAALPAAADFDVLLFFGLAQIPMYVLPALVKPFYRRLLRPALPDGGGAAGTSESAPGGDATGSRPRGKLPRRPR